jgi:hypothetical protein
VLASSALADTVSRSGGTLSFTAAPGQANNLSVTGSDEDGSIGFSDSGAPLSFDPSAGCSGDESGGACPGSGVNLISIDLGDGNDQYAADLPIDQNVSGGDGNDTLRVGYPFDPNAKGPHGRIDGGPGDDFLSSSGSGFTLVGGPGNDSVFANFSDKIDCAGGGDDRIARQIAAPTPKTINKGLIGCGSGPNVSAKLPRASVGKLLTKGYRFSIACDRPCAIYWGLSPIGPICHNTRCFGRGSPTVDPDNHVTWTLVSGRQSFSVRVVGSATRKATRRHRGALKMRLVIDAFDQYGAGRAVTRFFKMRH